eukprot:CAMPEP_0170504378 /NCGR_PEP_ID=MMETSP0208-20121228/47699_1 /TAXON_ID=197538 /ORGANISM="Strombidium inclinatum, Strain S3" /LENGTH=51 /DNA_ID=CAMNT_0010784603 /DNA_START=1714 /DNA_END=1869 /DNA_ORIENTATION=+
MTSSPEQSMLSPQMQAVTRNKNEIPKRKSSSQNTTFEKRINEKQEQIKIYD